MRGFPGGPRSLAGSRADEVDRTVPELEGEKFDATQVWAPAWARLEKKILALKFKVNEIKRRAESRGEQMPDLSKRSKAIDPIANFNENGDLKWNDELVKEIKTFAQRKKPRAAGGR